jgi:hypothetical protein
MKKNNYTQTLTLTLNKIFNNKIFSNKIFTNKITLIIVAAIAFLSLYRYIMLYEFSAVLLFFIVGAIAYSFTKNMIVVLGTSFLVTLIVELFKGLFGFKEGLESKTEETDDVLETDSVLETAKRLTESAMAPKDEEPNEKASNTKASNTKASNTKASSKTANSKESNTDESSKTTKDSYQNQIALNPGLYNMPNKEQMTKQLGKASETEQAYDNLEKIMGSKQLQSMSSDTKDLIKQQNDLIKQLKSMTPALNEAMSTLGTLDLSKLTNIFNKQPANTEDAN